MSNVSIMNKQKAFVDTEYIARLYRKGDKHSFLTKVKSSNIELYVAFDCLENMCNQTEIDFHDLATFLSFNRLTIVHTNDVQNDVKKKKIDKLKIDNNWTEIEVLYSQELTENCIISDEPKKFSNFDSLIVRTPSEIKKFSVRPFSGIREMSYIKQLVAIIKQLVAVIRKHMMISAMIILIIILSIDGHNLRQENAELREQNPLVYLRDVRFSCDTSRQNSRSGDRTITMSMDNYKPEEIEHPIPIFYFAYNSPRIPLSEAQKYCEETREKFNRIFRRGNIENINFLHPANWDSGSNKYVICIPKPRLASCNHDDVLLEIELTPNTIEKLKEIVRELSCLKNNSCENISPVVLTPKNMIFG